MSLFVLLSKNRIKLKIEYKLINQLNYFDIIIKHTNQSIKTKFSTEQDTHEKNYRNKMRQKT